MIWIKVFLPPALGVSATSEVRLKKPLNSLEGQRSHKGHPQDRGRERRGALFTDINSETDPSSTLCLDLEQTSGKDSELTVFKNAGGSPEAVG